MSPPIIWQNRRLMTRPRPVPPYLLAVVEAAWGELLEQLTHLIGRHADAGVATPMVTQSRPSSAFAARRW